MTHPNTDRTNVNVRAISNVQLLNDWSVLLGYVHNADSVGEAGALLPAGHYDHGVAGLDELA